MENCTIIGRPVGVIIGKNGKTRLKNSKFIGCGKPYLDNSGNPEMIPESGTGSVLKPGMDLKELLQK